MFGPQNVIAEPLEAGQPPYISIHDVRVRGIQVISPHASSVYVVIAKDDCSKLLEALGTDKAANPYFSWLKQTNEDGENQGLNSGYGWTAHLPSHEDVYFTVHAASDRQLREMTRAASQDQDGVLQLDLSVANAMVGLENVRQHRTATLDLN